MFPQFELADCFADNVTSGLNFDFHRVIWRQVSQAVRVIYYIFENAFQFGVEFQLLAQYYLKILAERIYGFHVLVAFDEFVGVTLGEYDNFPSLGRVGYAFFFKKGDGFADGLGRGVVLTGEEGPPRELRPLGKFVVYDSAGYVQGYGPVNGRLGLHASLRAAYS